MQSSPFLCTQRALGRVLAAGVVLLLAGCGVPDQPTAQSQLTAAAPTPTATPQAGADLNATVDALMLIEMQAARATAAGDAATATAWARQGSPAPATPTINTMPLSTATLYVTNTPPAIRPTLSPAEATRVVWSDANETAAANYDTTVNALPPAPQDGPLPVYPTSKPQPVGILNCQAADRETHFVAWNCWRTEIGTRIIMVSAGGDSGPIQKVLDPSIYREDNPTIRGGITVCTTLGGDYTNAICDPPYWRPEKEGRLKIVAVDGMRLTLESVIGSRYVFNVETREWEVAPAIPVPTATLLPDRVPYSTETPLSVTEPATITPAQTGVQHLSEWIPAFAGMTT